MKFRFKDIILVVLPIASALFTCCTTLVLSQKTPSGSTQSATVTTTVDSTNVSLKPSF